MRKRLRIEWRALLCVVAMLMGDGTGSAAGNTKDDATARQGVILDSESSVARSLSKEIFWALSPKPFPRVPRDVSNRWADEPDAALLGQRLFFDTRFSGPLLSSEHNGSA